MILNGLSEESSLSDQREFENQTKTELSSPTRTITFKPGEVVFGNYRIEETVGSGGAGVVFRAHNLLLDRVVALKLLAADTSQPTQLVRFQNEAKALSRIDHRNVSSVFDFGLGDGQTPYIIMEFIEGETLAREIENHGPLELIRFLQIFMQVAEGLSHAHSKNVIHRDLKSANIVLTSSQDEMLRAVIVDFGIARIESENLQSMTSTGVFIGSPLFASPEQIRGEKTTVTTDIYSLCCVMFHALVGEPPFLGETVLEILSMHQTSPVPPIVGDHIPDDLKRMIYKGLSKKPEDRQASVGEISDTLSSIISSMVPDTKRHEPTETARLIHRTKGLMLFLASLVIMAIVCCLTIDQRYKPSSTKISTDFSNFPLIEANILDDQHNYESQVRKAASYFAAPKNQQSDDSIKWQQKIDASLISLEKQSDGSHITPLASLCKQFEQQHQAGEREERNRTGIRIIQQCSSKEDAKQMEHFFSLTARTCKKKDASEAAIIQSFACEILRRHHLVNSKRGGEAFFNTGTYWAQADDPNEAKAAFEVALPILKEFDREKMFHCLVKLGNIDLNLQEFAAAVSRYKQADELGKTLQHHKRKPVGQLYVNWSRAELALGNAKEAENLLNKALPYIEEGVAVNPACELLTELGTTSMQAGEYNRARDWLNQAQSIFERTGKRSKESAKCLLRLAQINEHLGSNTDALTYFKKATEQLMKDPEVDNLQLAEAYLGLGKGLLSEKREKEGKNCLHRAIEICSKFDADTARTLSALSTMGQAFAQLESTDDALKTFKKAETLAAKLKDPGKDRILADVYVDWADWQLQLGNLNECERLYKKAIPYCSNVRKKDVQGRLAKCRSLQKRT